MRNIIAANKKILISGNQKWRRFINFFFLGVHGALMVYEPKFTAELLASLLSIPPNKTLLRRHLSTHFKELLGREIIQAKREAESTLGYIPLTPSAKVKVSF